MTETFRLRETVKYQGILSTLLFLAITVGTCLPFIVELPDTDGSPVRMAVFGCAVFGSMTLLAAYIWRAYYVEFVTIDDSGITIRSMMQNCRFDFAEPLDLRWRTAPIGGSILLRSCERKARLDLYGYRNANRLRIIQRLRRFVPPDRQIGWPEFCHDIALFLRENKPASVLFAKPADIIVIKRSRYDQILAYGLPLAIVVAVTASFLWDLREMLIIPIPMFFGWLVLRSSVPHGGRQTTRMESKLEGKIALNVFGGFLAFFTLLAASPFLIPFGFDPSLVHWLAVALFSVWMIALIWQSRLDRRRVQEGRKRHIELAVRFWDDKEELFRSDNLGAGNGAE